MVRSTSQLGGRTRTSHACAAPLTGSQIDRLLTLEGVPTESDELVFVSGSSVERLDTCFSDVDICIISPRKPAGRTALHKKRFSVSVRFIGERRVDFEYWSANAIANTAALLSSIRPGKDFVADALDDIDKLVIHRIRTAIPLRNVADFNVLRRCFDFERFRNYLVQEGVHRLDGALHDLEGLLADGDLESAMLRARDVATLAADVYLYWRGHTNTLPKWRVRLFRMLPADNECDRVISRTFLELQFPAAVSLSEQAYCGTYIDSCARFADKIVRLVQP